MATSISDYRIEDGIAVITIDSPPVNALSHAVREALNSLFRRAIADADAKAVMLICGGRTFFAGADIKEMGKPYEAPKLPDIYGMMSESPKPTIAAIHGTALGGGYELALVCDFRIATPSAKVGLPEVNLGIIPGAGGTQRLTRIVGPIPALDIMTTGRPVKAAEAQKHGMIDALAKSDTSLRADALAFARDIVASGRKVDKIRVRRDMIDGHPDIAAELAAYSQKHARQWRGFKAPQALVKAVEAAVTLPFAEGVAREWSLFQEVYKTPESAALRYLFMAERQTAKVPDLPATTSTRPVQQVGVVGAGTMGGGITMAFLNAGLPVTLVERNDEALQHGLAVIRQNYERRVQKGKMQPAEAEALMARITPTTRYADLASADLVVEAVYESMDVKKAVFAELAQVLRPDAILASNSSFLSIDEIAADTGRLSSAIGMHFFSPANVMPLLEVVRGSKTAPEVIKTVLTLAKKIRKTPVLSRICYGFIANRMMRPRSQAAYQLVLEGPTPTEIDKALYDYGFAMGPFAMIDLVGLDVIGRDSAERTLMGDLVARGRLGQKKNGGFYDYDAERRPTPSPVAAEVIADFAAFRGITSKIQPTAEEIVARLLYPVVNEGAKILEEGIALRASDIDVAAVLGYNWPRYRGGPMFWADQLGLERVIAGLEDMGIRPANLLYERARLGQLLSSR